MKINNTHIAIIAIIIFFFTLFGLTGLKLTIGILLLYILPFYLILDKFNLEKTEKFCFSFFIGIGIFPAITYYLAVLFNSMRIAVIVTFIVLLSLGLILKFIKE